MKLQKVSSLGVIYAMIAAFVVIGIFPEVTVIADTTSVEEGAASGVAIAQPTKKPAVIVPAKNTPAPVGKSKKKRTYRWKVKKKCSYPKKLNKGSYFTVKGTLISKRKLNKVVVGIKNSKGKYVYKSKKKLKRKKGKRKKISRKIVSLSFADNDLKFSKLKTGTYFYVVQIFDTKNRRMDVINKKFTVKKGKWSWPVYGGAIGDGWHCHCSSHHGRHFGIDIKGKGKAIRAISDGTVVYAKYHHGSGLGSFGKLVVIYHGKGVYSYYAHCSSIKVKAGKKIEQGDKIAKIGATGMAYGAHLHFELRKGPEFNGKYNSAKLVDKYTYKQFNPKKKIK